MGGILRSLGQWIVYGVLLLGATAIMLLGKADDGVIQRVRLQVTDAVVPILDGVSRPINAMTHAAEQIQSWIWLAEENAKLKADRERLLQWQGVARRLEAENAALRDLVKLAPDPQTHFVAARVVSNSTSTFAQSIVVNAGSSDGVKKANVVVSSEGLVGRVVAVSPRAAMIMLITDLNSRVPVLVGESRARAVLAGDNSDYPRLIHVITEAEIKPGDQIATSGMAGGFPPGLPIGVVAEVDGTSITVRPNMDRSRLEFVRVVDYEVPEMPGASASAAPNAAKLAAKRAQGSAGR
ncbi:rod shape-determining protein MreC [Defluviicoccus vanus]|uniref:Cell shape-determining protein MreC n=1 Tax=Defluviicoccus vanus TaxID=111831 RepID=A0A7H1N016_9PROT|nr:rod shape-determining protein MreC [Defluviicoccus vanus]QNT69052.1 rod shape-determining protein MreC [Defluviicoccus vanus]